MVATNNLQIIEADLVVRFLASKLVLAVVSFA